MQEAKQSKSERDYLVLLVEYFKEEEALKASLENLTTEIKEAGFSPTIMKTVAQAIARGKEEALVDKSEELIETVELYTTTS